MCCHTASQIGFQITRRAAKNEIYWVNFYRNLLLLLFKRKYLFCMGNGLGRKYESESCNKLRYGTRCSSVVHQSFITSSHFSAKLTAMFSCFTNRHLILWELVVSHLLNIKYTLSLTSHLRIETVQTTESINFHDTSFAFSSMSKLTFVICAAHLIGNSRFHSIYLHELQFRRWHDNLRQASLDLISWHTF